MRSAAPSLSSHKHEPHSVGFVLGSIMLVSAMIGLAAAYGVGSLLHRNGMYIS